MRCILRFLESYNTVLRIMKLLKYAFNQSNDFSVWDCPILIKIDGLLKKLSWFYVSFM